MSAKITAQTVKHIATLAQLPVSEEVVAALTTAFAETLAVFDNLQEIETASVEPTHQVTGLENVWREDTIDHDRMFTQAEALQNATTTFEGFFVVPQIIDQE